MKIIRTLLVASLLAPGIPARAAADQDEGWQAFGHALTLVQTLIGIAARSDDPKASLQGIDDVLAGRNPETNRAIAGLDRHRRHPRERQPNGGGADADAH